MQRTLVQLSTIFALIPLLISCGGSATNPSPKPLTPTLKAGVISYWGETSADYDKLPTSAVAVINPDNGVFVSAGQTTTLAGNLPGFKAIVTKTSARGVTLLGYVPTGYFDHACNTLGVCQTTVRIDAQVKAYFEQFPEIKGIFFDETTPAVWDCAAFPAEYQMLRDIVAKYKPSAKIAFNAGVPDNCAVDGTKSGEILVLFENDFTSYTSQATNVSVSTQAALIKGIVPWHLVHTVKTSADMKAALAQAETFGASYFYSTDIGGNWQAGENTWGSLPSYWAEEISLLAK